MKTIVGRLAVVLGLSIAVAATGGSAEAQTSKKPNTTKPAKKKKKKKPVKPGASGTTDLGDLEEDVPGPPPSAQTPTPPHSTPGSDPSAAPKADPASSASASDDDGDSATPEQTGPDGVKRISLALLLGVGFNGASCGTTTCNAYGFGVGLRAGYTLPMRVYVGGAFVYHTGFSQTYTRAVFTSSFRGSVSYLGAEAGYELAAGPVLVRPYLGLGLGLYSATQTDDFGANKGVTQESGGTKLALWPGVTGLYPITPVFFAGADLRFVVVPGGENAFSMFATGGMRF